ncbi:unnamed protein product, partial [Prorocentrum cordatum]
MRQFLEGYSGICNFNYKLREGGGMCILEANPRIGADLAGDVPRERARELFELLDSRCGGRGGARAACDGASRDALRARAPCPV